MGFADSLFLRAVLAFAGMGNNQVAMIGQVSAA
jgi:hypothetical protein